MKKPKNLKVIDILSMIQKGEDDFKFRVNDGVIGEGETFYVEGGIVYGSSDDKEVEWYICQEWLDCEARIVEETETPAESLKRAMEQLKKFVSKYLEDDED